jgi:GNAT superfamily N-acetyltransferase
MAETIQSPELPNTRSIAVPEGWIVEAITYLEMTAPASLRPEVDGQSFVLRRIHPDVEAYRDRYRRVGQDWLWRGRLVLSDAELSAIIDRDEVEIFDLLSDGAFVGFLELDFRPPGECQLAYFGVVPETIGSGAGRFLMNRTIERAWARQPRIRRLFVHTCTNDHPEALSFYRRSGFVAYAREIGLFPDPRSDGTLPETAAPQIPLISTS